MVTLKVIRVHIGQLDTELHTFNLNTKEAEAGKWSNK